ncbi:MAG TPA: hypothetical protein VI790_02520 [Candidatus Nanoarchaeia archaeon]|nr:hypothetical protein [Candidatus Nanoarchaeia archaeon]
MKITICASIAFTKEMQEAKKELETMGHEVKTPPTEITTDDGRVLNVIDYYNIRKKADGNTAWVWDEKEKAIKRHFEKIVWSDAILVLNLDKKGIKGYVGANTLMEMGLALHLGKKIYMINNIPEIDYKEEILGMKPIIIKNLDEIK